MKVKFINVYGMPKVLESSLLDASMRIARAVCAIDGVDQEVGDIGICFIDATVFTNVNHTAVRTVIDIDLEFKKFKVDDVDPMQLLCEEIAEVVQEELNAFLDDKSYDAIGVLAPEFSAF